MAEPDSEWEYEYDPNETEDFYFTIDITTNDPTATKGADRLLAAHRRASLPDQQNGDSHQSANPLVTTQSSNHAGHLQILDLHTAQPFIKLDNDLYGCEWVDDLGTQVFVARSGTVEEPARAGNKVDVIGLSQTRLLARPIQVRHNPAYKRPNTDPIPVDDDDNQMPTKPGVLQIHHSLIENEVQRKQASFLQRLSQIKADKQQHPLVFGSEVRHYKPPANKEEIRTKALEAIAAQEDEERLKAEAEKKAKPRKRKRYPAENELDAQVGAESGSKKKARGDGQGADENG